MAFVMKEGEARDPLEMRAHGLAGLDRDLFRAGMSARGVIVDGCNDAALL
jgi:hypothetical protein